MSSFNIRQSSDWDKVREYINRLPDKPYDVTIVLHRERRSLDQNAMYWGWLSLVEDETGNRRDDLHDAFRSMFLPTAEREVFGQTVRELTSTTKLDTKQFTEYLNRIDIYCNAELGIVLPHPEDAFWNDFVAKYGKL